MKCEFEEESQEFHDWKLWVPLKPAQVASHESPKKFNQFIDEPEKRRPLRFVMFMICIGIDHPSIENKRKMREIERDEILYDDL